MPKGNPKPRRGDQNRRGGQYSLRTPHIPTPSRPILIALPGFEIQGDTSPMAHAMGFRSFGPPGLPPFTRVLNFQQ
jgi:hypothetical protein